MNGFVQYSVVDAPAPSRHLLRRVEKEVGFVPNLVATFAESPALLEGLIALEAGLAGGTLRPVEQQIVMLVVSLENGCAYCAASHSLTAGKLHASREIINALRDASPVDDARMCALIRFVRLVVRNRGYIPEADVRAFLATGYTKGQALEVIGHVALKTAHNYVHALAQPPLDAAFESQRWEAIRVPLT